MAQKPSAAQLAARNKFKSCSDAVKKAGKTGSARMPAMKACLRRVSDPAQQPGPVTDVYGNPVEPLRRVSDPAQQPGLLFGQKKKKKLPEGKVTWHS